jgi:hypothetical protein
MRLTAFFDEFQKSQSREGSASPTPDREDDRMEEKGGARSSASSFGKAAQSKRTKWNLNDLGEFGPLEVEKKK